MTEWLIFTKAQVRAAQALNDKARALDPRLIDNPAHPSFGKYTLPASILAAPGYERFRNRVDKLPSITAEAPELFLPPDE